MFLGFFFLVILILSCIFYVVSGLGHHFKLRDHSKVRQQTVFCTPRICSSSLFHEAGLQWRGACDFFRSIICYSMKLHVLIFLVWTFLARFYQLSRARLSNTLIVEMSVPIMFLKKDHCFLNLQIRNETFRQREQSNPAFKVVNHLQLTLRSLLWQAI